MQAHPSLILLLIPDRYLLLGEVRRALTMEIYTQVPDTVTRVALQRLSDWLGQDEDQGDEARSGAAVRSALLYFAAVHRMQKAGPEIGTGR